MSRWRKPLTVKQVRKILRTLNFEHRSTEGSHEQWVKDVGGCRYKVTVDPPKDPFGNFLVKSMARQAGVSEREFYDALDE